MSNITNIRRPKAKTVHTKGARAIQSRRYSQRRIPGHPRTPLPSSITDAIWREVEQTALKFGVSRSFVVATALADALGIDLDKQDRYDTAAVARERLAKQAAREEDAQREAHVRHKRRAG
jgi:hypothetical protein